MTEHERAKAWREKRGLSIAQLESLTGYGRRAIYWFERGESPPNGTRENAAPVAAWVWHRYRMICAGVDAQLKSGKEFDW